MFYICVNVPLAFRSSSRSACLRSRAKTFLTGEPGTTRGGRTGPPLRTRRMS